MESRGETWDIECPESWDSAELGDIVRRIEASPTGAAIPPYSDHVGLLANRRAVQLKGLAAFWRDGRPADLARLWDQAIAALAQREQEFSFAVSFSPDDGMNYTILEADSSSARQGVTTVLESTLPGAVVAEVSDLRARARILNALGALRPYAAAVGAPSVRPDASRWDNGFLARLTRAVGAYPWCLLVRATPWGGGGQADVLLSEIARRVARVSPWMERTVPGQIGTSSTERDPLAQRYVELHEAEFKRVAEGRRTGLWDTRVYFLADDIASATAFHSAVLSLSTSDAVSSRLGVLPCAATAERDAGDPVTLLTSAELSVFTRPPSDELPGFVIREWAQFDASPEYSGSGVVLGSVHEHAGTRVSIPLADFTRHALVAGITGSGKTTAVWNILDQLDRSDPSVPFLVIEPTKHEYRSIPLAQPVRVYTLGDERVSPLRMNPFEVPAGILVQTHLDYLNALFRASFSLYPPMPYVLERCLYEVYTDCGWDLSSTGDEMDLRFPTLEDLSGKIDQVSARLGYGAEITMNVRAALLTRIDTLRIGAKGAMLDTGRRFDTEDFLGLPTVVELERVGNDEEKAFLMGLLLTRILEHRQAQGSAADGELRHVTVIEEAHRLLRNRPQSNDPESASPAAHAIEQFANMLAEVRSLGEGIIVAEQIPAKLAPDVIKNTNLKLVFRLPAEDDKRSVGSTINLADDQARVLTSLPRGEALVFCEGMDHPVRVCSGGMSLRKESTAVTEDAIIAAATGPSAPGGRSRASARVRQLAEMHTRDRDLTRLYRHWALADQCGVTPHGRNALDRRLARALTDRVPASAGIAEFSVATLEGLARSFLANCGVKVAADGLEQAIAETIRTDGQEAATPDTDAVEEMTAALRPVVAGFITQALAVPRYPFVGCARVCSSGGCLFRALAAPLADSVDFSQAAGDAMADPDSLRGIAALRLRAEEAGASVLTIIEPTAPLHIGVCALLQALNTFASESAIESTLLQILMEAETEWTR